MNLSENAVKVLEARYLRRDAQRRLVETPEELFESVAQGVAYAELLLNNARKAGKRNIMICLPPWISCQTPRRL